MSTLALPVQNGSARQHNLSLPMPPSNSPSMPVPALPNISANGNATTNTAGANGQLGESSRSGMRSPSVELKDIDPEDEDGEDDDDEEGGSGKKKRSGAASGAAKGAKKGGAEKGDYKYSSEIAQMVSMTPCPTRLPPIPQRDDHC
jgi:hypothetical protein